MPTTNLTSQDRRQRSPWSARRARWVPLVAVIAVLAAACAQTPAVGRPSGRTGQGYIKTPGVLTVLPAKEGRPGPVVTGTLLDGARFDSRSLAGKVVVFNVWGSWCSPCRAEAPELERTYQATRGLGAQFVGIDIRDNRPAANGFIHQFGVTYPSLFDPDMQAVLQLRDTLPPVAIPSTVILDRRGRVAARALGALTEDKLRPVVEAIAEESTP